MERLGNLNHTIVVLINLIPIENCHPPLHCNNLTSNQPRTTIRSHLPIFLELELENAMVFRQREDLNIIV